MKLSFNKIKTYALTLMIIFFIISAIIGSSMFLFGIMNEILAKILITTLIIGTSNLIILINTKGFNYNEIIKVISAISIICTLIPTIIFIIMTWFPELINWSNNLFKIILTLSLITFTITHFVLLLSKAKSTYRNISLSITTFVMIILSFILFTLLWDLVNYNYDILFRIIGTLVILDVCGSIVTALLGFMKK